MGEPGPSDWDVLARVAAGEAEAFALVVERHQERIVRVCGRLLQDPEEARDAAQEVFLKAFRKAGKLEVRGQLYSWLYRVAVNHCLNRLRRRRLVRLVPVARGEEEAEERPGRVPRDQGPSPLAALESRERWKQVRRAIGRLPPSQRAVLILAKFEGLSYREIAGTLGITVGAVESRLFRAMRKLEEAQETEASEVSRLEAER